MFQAFRNVTVHDSLREAFRDCGLADPRFADQNGIVLRSAGKNLDDTSDFFIPSDHRVQLLFRREFGEVTAIFVERAEFPFRFRVLNLRAAAYVLHGLEQRIALEAAFRKKLVNIVRLELGSKKGEQEMLSGHVLVTEFFRLVLGEDEYPIQRG